MVLGSVQAAGTHSSCGCEGRAVTRNSRQCGRLDCWSQLGVMLLAAQHSYQGRVRHQEHACAKQATLNFAPPPLLPTCDADALWVHIRAGAQVVHQAQKVKHGVQQEGALIVVLPCPARSKEGNGVKLKQVHDMLQGPICFVMGPPRQEDMGRPNACIHCLPHCLYLLVTISLKRFAANQLTPQTPEACPACSHTQTKWLLT